jgi:hypothetical protein
MVQRKSGELYADAKEEWNALKREYEENLAANTSGASRTPSTFLYPSDARVESKSRRHSSTSSSRRPWPYGTDTIQSWRASNEAELRCEGHTHNGQSQARMTSSRAWRTKIYPAVHEEQGDRKVFRRGSREESMWIPFCSEVSEIMGKRILLKRYEVR